MRIGGFNPYKYNFITTVKDLSNASSALSFQKEKNNSLQQKDDLIEKYQREANKELDNLRTQLKKADKEIKEMRDSSQIQLNCIIIARRIMSGHKVPKADYIYLAKNNEELYQKAILLRIERDNPLKFKKISQYEKIKCPDMQKSYIEDTFPSINRTY